MRVGKACNLDFRSQKPARHLFLAAHFPPAIASQKSSASRAGVRIRSWNPKKVHCRNRTQPVEFPGRVLIVEPHGKKKKRRIRLRRAPRYVVLQRGVELLFFNSGFVLPARFASV